MPPPRKTSNIASSTPAMPKASPAAPAPAPAAGRSEVKGSGSPKNPSGMTRQITQEQIALRAYEIYAGRGYAPGDQNADWLEAERQLKAGL